MKKGILLPVLWIVTIVAFAHEFWLSPQKFFYSIRETAHIRFNVGENFTGENWGGNKTKIQQLLHYTPSDTIINLSSRLSENKGDSLSLPLPETGTHMVVFHSTNSFIKLEAEKFNGYLQEDGLDNVVSYRKEHNQMQNEGKEYYQRSVKTILQVGDNLTDACTKPTSLPLDIIPEINPYTLPAELTKQGLLKVRFQVLFRGKPLDNALVKIWYRTPKKVEMEDLRADKKGWIITERHPGPFMVSCVHMERNTTDTLADWQSYWGSLSFEYSHFFPGSAIK
jgi:hypothetical protein